MKSLQLTKAAVVKPAITAISVFYIILLALLAFLIYIESGTTNGIGSIAADETWIFIGIFAMIHIEYLFKFSQNVCVSRKTCFISSIYTIVGLSIIPVILDIIIVLLGNLITGIPLSNLKEFSFGETNIFLTIILFISVNILGASLGMLIGITWYRLSNFVKICVGVTLGVSFFLILPQIAELLKNVTPPEWLINAIRFLDKLFRTGDIWTVLANIGLAAVLAGIFYLVLRKAQITEMK